MKLNIIGAWIAIVTATAGGLGVAYAAADRYFTLEERVAANTEQIQTDQWLIIDRKVRRGDPISKTDWIRWCKWGLRWGLHRNCQRPAPRPRRGRERRG